MSVSFDQLRQLAGLYNINTSYLDMHHRVQTATREALLAVLKAMDAPISTSEDVPSAIRSWREAYWQQLVEPVIVTWEREILTLNLHLPASIAASPVKAVLDTEQGEHLNLIWRGDQSSIIDSANVEGIDYVTLRFYLPAQLPFGYHKLKLDASERSAEALIISAPSKAYAPSGNEARVWGTFIPLYALHTHQSWGAGDFYDMETLMDWVSCLGGRLVGTLPLMPSFFDNKFGPGPYMPVSRLFWNEFYVNIQQLPELKRCPAALAFLDSFDFQKEITAFRSSDTVDYQRQGALKRRLIEEITEYLFTEKPEQYAKLQRYIESEIRLEDYARFRAAGEQYGIYWHDWPERMRNGILLEGDYSEKSRRYHLYSQFLAQEQINRLVAKSAADSTYLYLDLPVGVHPYSYDVWRERESFTMGVNGGAPPDPVFTSGQNWSFPPLHPERIRQQGYRYVINSLQHQLKCANMLRIDHMMNFHRLFWIPEGMENRNGVYVSYHPDEFYAILTLESYRHQAVIIGEDLGMVPPEVRPMMDKHRIYRMYVGQYELIVENQLGKIPEQSVASLNTHDMFPFSSFWQEKDISERRILNLVDDQNAQKELEERRNIKNILVRILQSRNLDKKITQDTLEIIKLLLSLLSVSPAYALLVNLEDLWLETNPQNIPGTLRSQNWSRKASWAFEEFSQSAQVLEILGEINHLRKSIPGETWHKKGIEVKQ